ncbi:MAG: protoporphyrinogen oxidase [Acidobacteria bacterium]|nr:protoporphyrinogen oxidase [Acidobacteriota bacterium]
MPRAKDKGPSPPTRIAIVGGGISGLSTAYFLSQRLSRSQAEIILLETSSRWGGTILSERIGEFVLEGGPDSFVSHKPQARELCRKLGLEGRLVESQPLHRKSYLLSQGKLHALPPGLFSKPPLDQSGLVKTPLLSFRGRLRAALEPLIPSANLEDESVTHFISRRLGREVAEKILEPLVVGIYGGDASALSIRSTLPHLFEAERTCGRLTKTPFQLAKSLLQRMDPRKGAAGRKEEASPLLSLQGGTAELIEALLREINKRVDLRLDANVSLALALSHGFQIRIRREVWEDFDVLILATPAYVSAQILSKAFPPMAKLLEKIPYASAIIVSLAYDEDILADRTGSGFLVTQSEKKTMAACTWMSNKFPGRCRKGHALLRSFVGGDQARKWMSSDNGELVGRIKDELVEILGIQKEPVSQKVYRWQNALPQYQVGHHERTERLSRNLNAVPGLYLVGNFLDGVGISDCIGHAERVSGEVTEERH